MDVREEDRKKTASTSRGLGLATAAIGLGVGAAALYYFLNKGSPNQETEAASSYERANVFGLAENTSDSDSYSTISEGTTSDTSVHDKTFEFAQASSMESYDDYTESDNGLSMFQNTISDISNLECISSSSSSVSDISIAESESIESGTDHNQSESDNSKSEHDCSDVESDYTESDNESDNVELANSEIEESDFADSNNSEIESDSAEYDNSEADSYSETDMSIQSNEEETTHVIENSNFVSENASHTESLETGYTSLQHIENSETDSDTMEWDITNTSIGIPSEDRSSSLLNVIGGLTSRISPRKAPQEDRLSKLRQRAFRERPWTLEECSICFEVMLRDQEVMTLACTHNFHAQCIMPWLQEKQTCPNCRKQAD